MKPSETNIKPEGDEVIPLKVCKKTVSCFTNIFPWNNENGDVPTEAGAVRTGWLAVPGLIWARTRCSLSRNSPRFSELSEPPSGLPDEYMVASLPSRMKRNQPLEPLDSSSAAASLQMYRQSRPRAMHQSRQWYGFPTKISCNNPVHQDQVRFNNARFRRCLRLAKFTQDWVWLSKVR